jgi:type IV pilus assembly protein PilM
MFLDKFLNRGRGLIGIDIGSSSVKIMELKQTRKGYDLINFGMAPLPQEAIVEGALMNSNAVEEKIREIISAGKISSRYVATSVSGHSVIIKKITLPQMSKEELDESIHWEAEQYIPFDIKDVNMDAQILDNSDSASGKMDIILVAAKSDLVNDYSAVIKNSGLEPVIIDVAAFALQNSYEQNYGINPQDTVVLVNIGASSTNMNIISRGKSIFTRDLNIGGKNYTEEIQKQMNISYEQAEALKISGNTESQGDKTDTLIPQEVGSIIKSVSESVGSELQRTIDFYLQSAQDEAISTIYLSGGTARIYGLVEAIENRLKIVNPFV